MDGKDVMIDLETLGQRPGCVILSIGAVAFDTDGIGDSLYAVVNTGSCLDAGLTKDPETVAWWDRQNDQAKEVLKLAETSGSTLADCLGTLTEFLSRFDLDQVRVWGNGADFDNAILGACYHAVGLKTPWKFYNNRCYRTLKSLRPTVKMERQGVYHNALDDAISQAKHAIKLMELIK